MPDSLPFRFWLMLERTTVGFLALFFGLGVLLGWVLWGRG